MISFIFKIQNSKKDFRQGKMNKIRIHRKIKDGSNSFNFEFPLPNWAFLRLTMYMYLTPEVSGVFLHSKFQKNVLLRKMNKIFMSGKKQRLMYFFQLWIPTAYLFSYFLLLMYKALNKINHLFMYVGKPIIFLML